MTFTIYNRLLRADRSAKPVVLIVILLNTLTLFEKNGSGENNNLTRYWRWGRRSLWKMLKQCIRMNKINSSAAFQSTT